MGVVSQCDDCPLWSHHQFAKMEEELRVVEWRPKLDATKDSVSCFYSGNLMQVNEGSNLE